MRTPLLAFDMGNVLLPFDHSLACERVAAESGHTKASVYERVFTSGLEEQFERGNLAPSEFVAQVSVLLSHNFDQEWLRTTWSDIFNADDEVYRLVAELSLHNELHLISNTNVWHFEYVTSKFPVLGLFGSMTLSYDVRSFKPEARMFNRITEESHSGRLIIYIDDIQRYADASEKHGAIGHTYKSHEGLRAFLVEHGIRGA